jgi:hypothetical protein
MYRKNGMLAAMAGCLWVWSIGATVVFEDTFSSATQWSPLVGNPSVAIDNGLVADNQSASWHALIANASMGDSYTFEVETAALGQGENRLGVLFSWEPGNGGYLFSVSTGGYYFVDKVVQQDSVWFDTAGAQITQHTVSRFAPISLTQGWSSWINAGENRLAVSKTGSTFQLACNGVLLTDLTDDSYSGDSAGLQIGAASRAVFRSATVTDQFRSFGAKKYFADDFEDGVMNGWSVWTNPAGVSEASGALSFGVNDSAARTIVYSQLDFVGSDIQVETSQLGGKDSSFYGLILMDFYVEYDSTYQKNVTRYRSFTYYINKAGQYAAFTSAASAFTPVGSDAITGTDDIITITSDYDFLVNGQTLVTGSELGEPYEFEAIALVAFSDADVAFDNFQAGDSSASAILVDQRPSIMPLGETFEIGGTGIIYDALGRGRRFVSARQAREIMKDMRSGPVFIIRKEKKAHTIRRAVIVK